ncbi:XdhC family aldehyde oxidoreductase maturation factor [Clostridium tyrobutyricum]|uniref:XdhC family aldehyde oxidoreductase maturation factor n=1 Tax=Clostridium tyrobutyricum TaxID=1519 RepID=UPI0011C913BB|nr:XdhC/CoxI family protein [Clostridium tyrobutyricum]
MNDIYKNIYKYLTQDRSILIATIYTSEGSSPRTSGAKMIIFKDKSIYGTIGGGRLEAQVIEASSKVFEKKENLIMKFDLNGVRDTDMICGGAVEVIIEYLSSKNADCVELYKEVANSIDSLNSCYIITSIDTKINSVKYDLYRDCKFIFNKFTNNKCVYNIIKDNLRKLKSVKINSGLIIVEPVLVKENVFIFGAGHVSQQIAKLTSMVGFNTIVIDDRAEFANKNKFPEADKILVLDDFKNCMDSLDIDDRSYIIIVTRGHKSDLIVLKQALKTRAYYIGGMGSKRKKLEFFNKLKDDGFDDKALGRIFIPIGIEIGSETPEEIAVSIVAELIQKRSQNIELHSSFAINDKTL